MPRERVRAALRLYRVGLVLTLVAALVGYAVILATTLVLRSMGGLRAISAAMSGVWGIAAVMMSVALWRLCSATGSGARRVAVTGFALQVPAALAELGLLALSLATIHRPYFSSHQVLVHSGWLQAAAQTLGLSSAICVVVAVRRSVEAAGVRRRSWMVLALLGALLLLVILLRGALVAGLRIPGWPIPALAVSALLLCGPALLSYLRLIGAALGR